MSYLEKFNELPEEKRSAIIEKAFNKGLLIEYEYKNFEYLDKDLKEFLLGNIYMEKIVTEE